MGKAGKWQEWNRGRYRVTTDPAALHLDTVHGFLRTTSWAAGLPREKLALAIAHSICFSLLDEDRQVGFARVITDYATYAYLCDVYVTEGHRGQGLGRWMMMCVFDHAVLGNLRRIALLTHDAEAFYRELGFTGTRHGSIYLERLRMAQE